MATITGIEALASATSNENAPSFGPFYYNGKWYGFWPGASPNDDTMYVKYATSDPNTDTWGTITTNAPTSESGNSIAAYDCWQDEGSPQLIHVALCGSVSDTVVYARFDCSSGTNGAWVDLGTSDYDIVATTSANNDSGGDLITPGQQPQGAAIVERSNDGDIFVFGQGNRHRDMGNNYANVIGASSTNAGGSFGNQFLSSNNTASNDFCCPRAVVSGNNRIYCFHGDYNNDNLYVTVLRSTDTTPSTGSPDNHEIDTGETVVIAANAWQSIGKAIAYNDGTERIRAVYLGANTRPRVLEFDDADTPSVFSSTEISTQTVKAYAEGFPLTIEEYSGDEYVFWINDATDDLVYSINAGTPTIAESTATVANFSTNRINDGSEKIAYFILKDQATDAWDYGEISLDTGAVALEASASSTSSGSATLDRQPGFVADASGTSSASAELDTQPNLESSLSTVSSITATISNDVPVESSLSTVSSATATLDRQPGYEATSSTSSSASTTLDRERGHETTVSTLSTGAAELDTQPELEADASTTSSASAELDTQPALEADLSISSSITADLDITATVALEADASSTSSATATMDRQPGYVSDSSTVSTISVEMDTQPELEADLSTVSTGSAELDTQPALESSLSTVSSVTADLTVTASAVELESSLSTVSTISAEMDTQPALEADASTVSSATATMDRQPGYETTVSTVSSASAEMDITGQVDLEASASGTSSATATMDRQPGYVSNTSTVSSASASMDTQPALEATISSTVTGSATLDRQPGYETTVSTVSSASAELSITGQVDLEADASGTSSASAEMYRDRPLQTDLSTLSSISAALSIPAGSEKLFIGGTAPSEIYIGNTAISAIYVGSTQVWP